MSILLIALGPIASVSYLPTNLRKRIDSLPAKLTMILVPNWGFDMQIFLILFAIVLSLLHTTVSAQDESEYERLHRESDIERQAMIAENLPLLDSEAEAFWDLYLEYRVADREMDDQRVELIRHFEEADDVFTDDEGKRIVMEALRIEQQRQAFKQQFFEKFSLVLPGSKLIRYYQIESKLDAVKRYFWTSGVPMAPLAE